MDFAIRMRANRGDPRWTEIPLPESAVSEQDKPIHHVWLGETNIYGGHGNLALAPDGKRSPCSSASIRSPDGRGRRRIDLQRGFTGLCAVALHRDAG